MALPAANKVASLISENPMLKLRYGGGAGDGGGGDGGDGGLGGGGGGGGGGAGRARKEMKSVSAGVVFASRNTARLQYPWTPVYATAAQNTIRCASDAT